MDIAGKSFAMTSGSSIGFKDENNQFSTSRDPTMLQILTDTISLDNSQILVDKLVLMPRVSLSIGVKMVLGNLTGGCFDDINGKEMDVWFT